MEFSLEQIKKHPVKAALIIVAGLFVVYWLIRFLSSGGGSQSVVASNSPSPADLQMAQIQAASAIQQSQIAAQSHGQELQAQVATDQIAAQLEASQLTTAAQLKAAELTTAADLQATLGSQSTQVALAQIQSDTQKAQFQSVVDLTESNNALWESAINAGVQENATNVQGEVDIATLQAGIAEQQIQAKAQTDVATIGLIKSGQLNKGGFGGAAQIAALSAIYNNAGPASVISADQPALVSSSASSIVGKVSGGIGTVLSHLF